MTEREIQEQIEGMVRRIVDRFQPERIILFGSHARGTAQPDSDVDLLVVMDVRGSLRSKANEIDLALVDRQLPLDLLVVTPEQFERQKLALGSVVRYVAREGKQLYDRAA